MCEGRGRECVREGRQTETEREGGREGGGEREYHRQTYTECEGGREGERVCEGGETDRDRGRGRVCHRQTYTECEWRGRECVREGRQTERE